MKVVEYNEEYRAQWKEFVDKAPSATIAHQIGWREVIETGLGHEPVYLMAMEGESIRGVLPLFLVKTIWRSRYLISLPWIDYGGVCALDPAAARALLDEVSRVVKTRKVQFAEFRSVDAVYDDLPVLENKVTFLLNLNKAPEFLLKDFNGKLRNQIKKAGKSDLNAEFGGLRLLPEFYKVFSWKMRSLGTPVWGFSFFENILKVFPETARIVIIRKDGAAIAGGLLLAFKDRLYVPSAASYRSALKYCPNHALYWEVIKRGCEEKYDYFDFGRSRVDSSTYNFKKQWVPNPTQLKWQYYLTGGHEIPAINPSSSKYKLLINIWRRLPLSLANYLGPRIIRNFP